MLPSLLYKKSYAILVVLLFVHVSCVNNKTTETAGLPHPDIDLNHKSLRASKVTRIDGFYNDDKSTDHSFFIRYQSGAEKPTPLIIAFHGGGFLGGNKSNCDLPFTVNMTSAEGGDRILLADEELDLYNFAYASANYTLLSDASPATLITSLTDCKDFLDYIRANDTTYNIDPDNIILLGISGGAATAMWIGLQENNIKGIVAISPQASLNILDWRSKIFKPVGQTAVFDENIVPSMENLSQMSVSAYSKIVYGQSNQEYIAQYSAKNHLNIMDLIDENDPELYLECTAVYKDVVHQTSHVYALKNASDSVGHQSRIQYTNVPQFLNTPESIIEFCSRKCQN